MAEIEVTCYGQCGKKTDNPSRDGWEYLPITGKYRCFPCSQELELAAQDRREETKDEPGADYTDNFPG